MITWVNRGTFRVFPKMLRSARETPSSWIFEKVTGPAHCGNLHATGYQWSSTGLWPKQVLDEIRVYSDHLQYESIIDRGLKKCFHCLDGPVAGMIRWSGLCAVPNAARPSK